MHPWSEYGEERVVFHPGENDCEPCEHSPGLSATPLPRTSKNQLSGTLIAPRALFLVQLKNLSMTMCRKIRTPSKVNLETQHMYQDYHHHMRWRLFIRRSSPGIVGCPSRKSQHCNVPTSCKELPLSGPRISLLNRGALFHII